MRMSLEDYVRTLERSELLENDVRARAQREFQDAHPAEKDGKPFAEFLIQKGLLTVWQAEKILQGKHRGFTLGRYRLLSLLGKGGMSSVYLAEHRVMKRRCALKVLPARKAKNASYLNRFHREARAVASLDHRNIVRAYDIDEAKDGALTLHFLVMEYIQGKTLFEVIRSGGPLTVAKALDFMQQAATGLQHAHQAGLIHRDVKPENLILDRQGVVKVMDLGLARFFDSNEEQLTIHQDERILGTANYCSPEQAVDSHLVDARTDIYSLGCTFYYVLMGHPPFNTGTLAQRLMAHQSKEPPPIQSKRPDVPDEVVEVVRRMMAKTRDARFQSMTDVAARLQELRNLPARRESAAPERALLFESKTPPTPAIVDPSPSDEVGEFVFPDFESLAAAQAHEDTDSNVESLTPSRRSVRSVEVEKFFEELSDQGVPETQKTSGTKLGGAGPRSTVPESVSAPASQSATVQRSDRPRPATELRRRQVLLAGITLLLAICAGLTYIAFRDSTPTRPIPTGREDQVSVGPTGHFATVTEALAAISKTPLKARTIKVSPGYASAERIVLAGGPGGQSLKRLRILCDAQPAAILRPADPSEPIISVSNMDDLVVDGLVLDAAGAATAVRLSGFLDDCEIAHCTFRGFSQSAIEGQEVVGDSSRKVVLQGLTFDRASSPSAVAIRWQATAPRETSEIQVLRNRFLGGMTSAVEFSGPLRNVTVESCIFHKLESGIRISRSNEAMRGLSISHNTFSHCGHGLLLAGQPAANSSPLRFSNNLFVSQTGTEATMTEGWTPQIQQLLFPTAAEASQNWSDRPVPDQPDAGALDVFQSTGRRGVTSVKFMSLELSSRDFLRPADHSVVVPANAANPTGGYVGAIEP